MPNTKEKQLYILFLKENYLPENFLYKNRRLLSHG